MPSVRFVLYTWADGLATLTVWGFWRRNRGG